MYVLFTEVVMLITEPSVVVLQVEMALEALYNVIHNNAGVETQCNGHFKLLFSFFRFQGAKKMQLLTLKVHVCPFIVVHTLATLRT